MLMAMEIWATEQWDEAKDMAFVMATDFRLLHDFFANTLEY